MHELWSSASYQPHAWSLAFAFAPAAMSIVIAYALVMRGAAALRGWLLVHFASLLPYALCTMMSPSIVDPHVADLWFRFGGASIPMAAAGGAGFQFALLGKLRAARWLLVFAFASSVAWIAICASTDLVLTGVRWMPIGLWYANAGPLAWLALVTTLTSSLPGFIAMAVAAVRSEPTQERRQLRLVLAANLTTYAGLVDVALAYDIGVFPIGWLLSGIGSLLVVRALLVEDLLRARAFDTTAPRLVLHLAVGIGLALATLALLGPNLPWWAVALALIAAFAGARVTIAVVGLVNRGSRTEDTLSRLLGQLVSRSRGVASTAEVAQLAIDVIDLGVGARVEVLVAAVDDWGWTTAHGTRVADELAPDPLLVGWLASEARRGAVFGDDLSRAPEDLRELLAKLFVDRRATVIVPVAAHDELLALVVVPTLGKRLRGRALAFVEHAGERLGEALVHVRMAARAAARAELAREVELAAAVQQQLLPDSAPRALGDITVVGSWQPATRCAGDFWACYELAGGRVLVAIGDVTGHGVASATVTAAAAAACEVVVRRDRSALALEPLVAALEAAVRRVGGGQLAMTCCAAILDPVASELRFVSCGHTTPYLCRPVDTGVELVALVARGNPLGGEAPSIPKVQHKTLAAGDLVVWYTDGVIDAPDAAGQEFGNGRLQRLLRRLDRARLAPVDVHDVIHAALAAHRGAQARLDDETIVVAQWQPRAAGAST